MQRCIMLKNIQQKLTGNQRIQLDTGSYILGKLGVFSRTIRAPVFAFPISKEPFTSSLTVLSLKRSSASFPYQTVAAKKGNFFSPSCSRALLSPAENNGRCHKDRIDAFADQKQNGIQVQKCGNKDKTIMTRMPFIRVHARVFRIQIRMWYNYKGKYDDLQHIGISKT